MTELRSYADTHADTTNVLGRLVISTVGDTRVDHHLMATILDRHGLGDYQPKPPADSDIFRRVSKSVERKREDLGDGTYLNVLVRDVTTANTNEIIRRVVVEKVDPKGKRLEYTEAWDLSFDKEHGTMSTRRLPDWRWTEADASIQDLAELYRQERGTLDGPAVARTLQRIFDGKHAVSARRSGGIVFFPKQHMAATRAIKDLAGEFPTVEVTVVPLLDAPDAQEDVSRFIGQATERDVRELMEECSEVIQSGDATPRRLAGMGTRFRHCKDRLNTYRDLLDNDLGTLLSQIDMLDKAMSQALVSAVTDDA